MIELNCLLDVGKDRGKELEDELTLSRNNVVEARPIAVSYGADVEDLESRALAVASALADDVSEKALLVESLAMVAQEAVLGATPALDTEDRWGSHTGHDMIRSHVEAVQRLVFTATFTLVEEVSSCDTVKGEVMGREAETQERMNGVEDDLIACYNDDENRFTKKLAKAMKSLPPSDIELVRALADDATTKGFRSAATDEATKAVTKNDDQESAITIFRSLPGALVRQVSKASLVVARPPGCRAAHGGYVSVEVGGRQGDLPAQGGRSEAPRGRAQPPPERG